MAKLVRHTAGITGLQGVFLLAALALGFPANPGIFAQSPERAPGSQAAVPPAGPISSGRINSRGKFSFQYGRLDASIRLPRTADGLWPAFWLLGAGFPQTPWPDCGEIDVLEMGHRDGIASGRQARYFGAAAHWGPVQSDGSHPSHGAFVNNRYALQYGDFHLFTLVRSRRWIRMYLDLDKLPAEQRGTAKPYFEMEITPELEPYFSKPFFIVLNLAAGGNYPGIFEAGGVTALNEANGWQAAMYVDYIRAWDEKGVMIFNDEFNAARLDSGKWNIEENDSGGGNAEVQVYRRQNITLGKDKASGKGCLVITARRENP
ncbi:MAG: family 16 glycosylhydrolase [Treponema sp.]|jgi:beta-glucanase (GH16 family)|nr:family 16 glycosylhydrolase [Treponema sp.]